MRRFLTARTPPLTHILLVESGSRHVAEKALSSLYSSNPDGIRIDLVTCYGGSPRTFQESTGSIYRVQDYGGRAGRKRLYRQLRANRYNVVAIICSGEPIMTKWKWVVIGNVPVKVLVINENADYFWLDRANWSTVSHIVAVRTGLSGAGAVTTLARVVVFPFTLVYLLLFAAFVHLRRKVAA